MEAASVDFMKRMVASLRRETLESVLEEPLQGREVKLPSGSDSSMWFHAAPSGKVRPVVLELHGGGFALGDARKEDALCSWIARRFDVNVAAVNYRLAPEHPWPAALDDVMSAIDVLADRADEFGADPRRLHCVGYSGGANLAVAAALALGERDERKPGKAGIAGLALYYPFFDAATDPRRKEVREIDLPLELMEAFNRWYVGDNDPRNPLISPLYATDAQIKTLPRTVMYPVLGDAMCDEALVLAARMREVGARVSVHVVEGAYHGYIEDAANLRVYRETNPDEVVETRPASAVRVARDTLIEGLSELLGTSGAAQIAPSFLEEGLK